MKTLLGKSLTFIKPRVGLVSDMLETGLLSVSSDKVVEIQRLFDKYGIDPSVYGNNESVNNSEALVSLIHSLAAEIDSIRALNNDSEDLLDEEDFEEQDIVQNMDADAETAELKAEITAKLKDKTISDLTQMYGYPAQWAKFSPAYSRMLKINLVDWCNARNIKPLSLWVA